jgi:hypothetical protein
MCSMGRLSRRTIPTGLVNYSMGKEKIATDSERRLHIYQEYQGKDQRRNCGFRHHGEFASTCLA